MGELYKLTFRSGKSYIGIAFDSARRRFAVHCYNAKSGKLDILIYRAWRKHGAPELKVLAVVENDLLHSVEIAAISSYGTVAPAGYNRTAGGEGVRGLVHSAESKAKIAAASLRLTPESRAKMSASATGRKLSEAARAKISAANKNPTQETRNKKSAALRGRFVSAETRAKIAASLRGKVFSSEQMKRKGAKISTLAKGRPLGENHKENIRSAMLHHFANRKSLDSQLPLL